MKRPLPKPRDPFVQHIVAKKQGAHGKTKKAVRRKDKVEFQKQTREHFSKAA